MTDKELAKELENGKELVEALKRVEERDRRRGHATYFHADNESQGLMEVGAVRDWAEEMNRRGCHVDIDTIRKNDDPYPDCLAEMDGEKIGVEVVELVDENAIKEHPELPPYEEPEQFMRESSKLPIPMSPEWPPDKFQRRLDRIVRKKDKRVKDGSLSKQFLLIVTDEPRLDETTLSKYLKTTKLQQPQHFDGVYLGMSYMPDSAGKGRGSHPVFEVSLQDRAMRA